MLNVDEKEFIQKHLSEDVSVLAFQKNKYPGLDLPKLLFQIQSRQKLSSKLPNWVQNLAIYFPPQISIEQSSSERSALFKSNLISGKIIDLTGGMGLDSWAFAQNINNQVTYVEINEQLKKISEYNHHQLGLDRIIHFHADGMEFIQSKTNHYDWIYMDPARRDTKGKKVFLLKDCTPNATQILSQITEKTGLLLKVSPMLDIDLCIKELNGVNEVHIVCIQNEIKELLFKKIGIPSNDPELFIWDIHKEEKLIYKQIKSNEREKEVSYSKPLQFLYEPHAGILKAGFFKSICQKDLFKISTNTHLYTSEHFISNFPGKSFAIKSIGKLDANWIKSELQSNQANISCRNFPLTPEEIRKKLQLKDGGEKTLFAFRNSNQETQVVICQKT